MDSVIRDSLLRRLLAQNWKTSLRSAAHAVLAAGFVSIVGCSGGGGSSAKPAEPLIEDPASSLPVITPTPQPTPPTPTPVPLAVKTLIVNPEVVSKDVVSNASHQTPQIAFTNLGAGIAAWSVSTGNGYRALYSVYDAVTKTWSPEQTLAISDLVDPQPRVISNGMTLLLVWGQDYDVYGRIYTPAPQPSWSDAHRLNDDKSRISINPANFSIATDGQTYLVSWESYYVYARMFSGNNWTIQPEIISTEDNANGFQPVTGFATKYIAGGMNGYVTAWFDIGDGKTVPRDTTRIRANVYRKDIAAWTGPITVDTEQGSYPSVQMVSNDIGHALYWTYQPTASTTPSAQQARGSVFDTRLLPVMWSTPVTLSTATQSHSASVDSEISLAASKTEFAAVWVEQISATSTVDLRASHYSVDATGTAAWRSASSLATAKYSSNNVQIVGSDNGFACAWVNDGGLVRAIYSGGTWFVDTPLAPIQDTYISLHALATHANEYALAYSTTSFVTGQADEKQSFAMETFGNQWSAPIAVLPMRHGNMWSAQPAIAASPSGFWYAVPLNAADATDHFSNVVIRRPGAAPDTVEKLATDHYSGSANAPVLAANSGGDLLV